ncbi:hypothetical protein GCM10011608_10150 [Micromonospora sonchi]|uniref:Uncharacterized protein n=1 Tax=Micromonospora sonchi TaxID=1763543 RepID=A0A917WT94_9ACTN|nr:hypothetical protein GCM10011608_10150 [Micromonospora sonchi]
MSRLDEPIDAGSVEFSAALTLRAHDEERRCCVSCPGKGGCRQEAWAREQLPDWPARRQVGE